jgi:tetratricopeptide (TPR) repeat protein
MAKIYTQQGHYDHAIEIYRRLLKDNPEQPDLIEALREAKRQQKLQNKAKYKKLSALIKEWIELMHKYRLIKKLNRLWGRENKNGIDE